MKFIITNSDGLVLSVVSPKHPTQAFLVHKHRKYAITTLPDAENFEAFLDPNIYTVGLVSKSLNPKLLSNFVTIKKLNKITSLQNDSNFDLKLNYQPLMFKDKLTAKRASHVLSLKTRELYTVKSLDKLPKHQNGQHYAQVLLISKNQLKTNTDYTEQLNLNKVTSIFNDENLENSIGMMTDIITWSLKDNKLTKILYNYHTNTFKLAKNTADKMSQEEINKIIKPHLMVQTVGQLIRLRK